MMRTHIGPAGDAASAPCDDGGSRRIAEAAGVCLRLRHADLDEDNTDAG